MFSSHSMVQNTETTVSWPWRTLMKMIMPCSVLQTQLLVVDKIIRMKMGPSWGTGFLPIDLKFPEIPIVVDFVISTWMHIIWWYVWTTEEVEWKGSTCVRYLIQWTLPRPYTLECTQQALVCQPSMFPRYTSLVSPSLARRQTNAVGFVSKVRFSLFDGSEVIAWLTSSTKGKYCIV